MSRTIEEVSDPYANFMLNPAAAGPGVCSVCWTFHDPAYDRCYACGGQPQYADVVVPITYSVGNEQMHHALRNYKDGFPKATRDRFTVDLLAVLWRFLRQHEQCLADAAGAGSFDLVTVVPSRTTVADDTRTRLRDIVGEYVGATAPRFERVLGPTNSPVPGRRFDAGRFRSTRPLDGSDVLLIDDTWTTGASVESAAYALKAAGADRVGVVVIGRHLNRDFGDNNTRLRTLPAPFDWDTCAVHH